jgi:hypothetical protein
MVVFVASQHNPQSAANRPDLPHQRIGKGRHYTWKDAMLPFYDPNNDRYYVLDTKTCVQFNKNSRGHAIWAASQMAIAATAIKREREAGRVA